MKVTIDIPEEILSGLVKKQIPDWKDARELWRLLEVGKVYEVCTDSGAIYLGSYPFAKNIAFFREIPEPPIKKD